ncbi:hypothetical protein L6452_38734 [Arctium lappa]|uniref:Uncharacterized protein n=1 Tax=Arctium lappa TaxID=4217 RepID=A0ACB8XRI7_ARCLA|nr:hypothetical protein L6452_38734 [Arctium lappa]
MSTSNMQINIQGKHPSCLIGHSRTSEPPTSSLVIPSSIMVISVDNTLPSTSLSQHTESTVQVLSTSHQVSFTIISPFSSIFSYPSPFFTLYKIVILHWLSPIVAEAPLIVAQVIFVITLPAFSLPLFTSMLEGTSSTDDPMKGLIYALDKLADEFGVLKSKVDDTQVALSTAKVDSSSQISNLLFAPPYFRDVDRTTLELLSEYVILQSSSLIDVECQIKQLNVRIPLSAPNDDDKRGRRLRLLILLLQFLRQ